MARAFDRVLIIMFENMYREYVMANPYMRGLARQGIDMSNFHGVMHPSQTNYIASIAGELCNVTGDLRELLPQRTIVDLIEEAPGEVSWKAYMDSYRPAKTPWSATLKPVDDFPYVIKHNPFSSFENIVRSEARWQRVVNEAQLFKDILSGDLPNYAWFTPDMWNDGHYLDGTTLEPEDRAPALVDQLARWLEDFFAALDFPGHRSKLPQGTLVVVTFDESDFLKTWATHRKGTYDGPNQIYTALLGDMIEPGVEDGAYNHYNLLKTIERNFGLGHLNKNDTAAAPLRFLWGERFAWERPESLPLTSHTSVATASFAGLLQLVVRDATGALAHLNSDGCGWGDPRPLGVHSAGPIALAAREHELMLIYEAETGKLQALRYDLQHGWSESPEVLGEGSACALCSFDAQAGAGLELMAVWVDPNGHIQSRRRNGEGWGEEVATGHLSRGDVALAALGPSLFVVFEAPGFGHCHVHAATYNSASFNVTTIIENQYVGPWDDATVDQWSPSAFSVGRFGAASTSASTPEELEPVTLPIRAGAPLVLVCHEGELHLVHVGVANRELLTERFSVPGILTSKLPVSYDKCDEKKTSNGYGTLAEAGWTAPRALASSWVAPGGGLAAASHAGELVLISQVDEDGALRMRKGSYHS